MTHQTVQILTFEGCPNRARAIAFVDRVVAESGISTSVEVVDVADPAQAVALRFLGSPTIRVDGMDIESGAGERDDFALACRVYRTEAGLQGLPDPNVLELALAAEPSA